MRPLTVAYRLSPRMTQTVEALGALEGVDLISWQEDTEAAEAKPDVVVTISSLYDTAVADRLRRLGAAPELVQLGSTGWDGVMRNGLPPGTRLCNAGDAWAPTVAEHALALLLGLLRGLPMFERDRQDAAWRRAERLDAVRGLAGTRVAVLGFGAIGRAFARRAAACEARIVGISASGRPHPEADESHAVGDLLAAVRGADALVVALPLLPETRGIVGRDVLAALAPGACVVNVGRGGLIDDDALLAALDRGHLAGAGLDVLPEEPLPPSHPYWARPDIIVTPHVGGMDHGRTLGAVADKIAENLRRLQCGEPLQDEIDSPLIRRWGAPATAGGGNP